MTATNINIDEFVNILVNLRNNGARFVNLDLVPEENRPDKNKLVISPVRMTAGGNVEPQRRVNRNFIIKNPEVRTDNDDIFKLFNGLV